jgi:hypothetical protein
MLSTFELCQQLQGSCFVYIRETSECYIVCITQDLECLLPFYIPLKNFSLIDVNITDVH